MRVPIVALAVLVLAAAACGGTGTTAAPAGGGAAEWKYGGELGPGTGPRSTRPTRSAARSA